MPDILLHHFYKLNSKERNGNEISAQITFDAAHPIFQGHFPDMPIVPGVCQTQILGEVLSQAFGAGFELQNAVTIRFLAPIDPVQQPTINLSILALPKEDHTYTVTAQYTWAEKVFFKLKGTYLSAS